MNKNLNSYLRNIKSYLAINLNLPILYSNHSFSQDGEDLILEKLFINTNEGLFVDVGAHHPFRYSNTQLLYQKGWSGLNIDPTPKSKIYFDKVRKKDINIQDVIGEGKNKSTLYCFSDSALNTTSKKRADITRKTKQSKLIGKIKVETKSLKEILSKHLKNKKIDLLNVDVEGNEMEVLRTNNWNLYSPKVIVIENLNHEPIIAKFLKKYGYNMIDKTTMSEVYKLTK